jgi:hypothetical protein
MKGNRLVEKVRKMDNTQEEALGKTKNDVEG